MKSKSTIFLAGLVYVLFSGMAFTSTTTTSPATTTTTTTSTTTTTIPIVSEFGSTEIAAVIILVMPAFAYLLVKKK